MTVKELRQAGFKVSVYHERNTEYNSWGKAIELAKGGNTFVDLTIGNAMYKGMAICHPKENYNKKEGVRVALNRAIMLALLNTGE